MSFIENLLNRELLHIGDYTLTGAKIIGVIALLIGMVLLNKALSRIILSLEKRNHDLKLKGKLEILDQLKSYVIYVLALIFILQILGVNIGILIASSAALFVAIGLGLQNIVNNFVSGLSLMFGTSISINDTVRVDNILGRVKRINFRTTEIITPLDQSLLVPNSKLIEQTVQSFSHGVWMSGFEIPITVAYDTDIKKVTKVLIDCGLNQPEVLQTKGPQVFCTNFGESGFDLSLHIWVEDTFRIERIKSDIRFRILEEFRKQNIEIPYPQRVVELKK